MPGIHVNRQAWNVAKIHWNIVRPPKRAYRTITRNFRWRTLRGFERNRRCYALRVDGARVKRRAFSRYPLKYGVNISWLKRGSLQNALKIESSNLGKNRSVCICSLCNHDTWYYDKFICGLTSEFSDRRYLKNLKTYREHLWLKLAYYTFKMFSK